MRQRQGADLRLGFVKSSPGIYAHPNRQIDWALQDIHAIGPPWRMSSGGFRSSTTSVDPWLTPIAPPGGCTEVLETGDPVVGIGYSNIGQTPTNPES